MMTHEIGRYQVERVYWSVSAAVLSGVVDEIRTALTELVAEMRARMAGGEVAPTPEVAGQAIQFVVYGKDTASRSLRRATAAQRLPLRA